MWTEQSTADALQNMPVVIERQAITRAKEIFREIGVPRLPVPPDGTPAANVLMYLRQVHAPRDAWLRMLDDTRKHDLSVAKMLVEELPLHAEANLSAPRWSRRADEAETTSLAAFLNQLLVEERYEDVVAMFDAMQGPHVVRAGGLLPSGAMCQHAIEAMLVLKLPVEDLLLRMERAGISPTSRPRLVARYNIVRFADEFNADRLPLVDLLTYFSSCMKVSQCDLAFTALRKIHAAAERPATMPAALSLGCVELTKQLCDRDRYTDALHVCHLFSLIDADIAYSRTQKQVTIDADLLRVNDAMLDQSKFDLEKAASFGKMQITNPVGNALIAHLCGSGRVDDAMRVLQWAGGCSDEYILAKLVQALCRSERIDDALALMERMFDSKRPQNVYTYAMVIQALIALSEHNAAVDLFLAMDEYDQFLLSLLLSKMCKFGNMVAVRKVIARFEEKPLPVTNSFLARQLALAYAQLDNIDRAIHFIVVSARTVEYGTVSALFGVLNYFSRTPGDPKRADQIDYVADKSLRMLNCRHDSKHIHRVMTLLEPFQRHDLEFKWQQREYEHVLVGDTRELHGSHSETIRRLRTMVDKGLTSVQDANAGEPENADAAEGQNEEIDDPQLQKAAWAAAAADEVEENNDEEDDDDGPKYIPIGRRGGMRRIRRGPKPDKFDKD